MNTAEVHRLCASSAKTLFEIVERETSPGASSISAAKLARLVDQFEGAEGIMVHSAFIANEIGRLFVAFVRPDEYASTANFVIFADGSILLHTPEYVPMLRNSVLKFDAGFDFETGFEGTYGAKLLAATPALRSRLPDMQDLIIRQHKRNPEPATSVFRATKDLPRPTDGIEGKRLEGRDYHLDSVAPMIAAAQIIWQASDAPAGLGMHIYSSTEPGLSLDLSFFGDEDLMDTFAETFRETLSVFVDPNAFHGFACDMWVGKTASLTDIEKDWLHLHTFKERVPPSKHVQIAARAKVLEACERQGRADLATKLEADWSLGLRPSL